jgi:hypothetical protein
MLFRIYEIDSDFFILFFSSVVKLTTMERKKKSLSAKIKCTIFSSLFLQKFRLVLFFTRYSFQVNRRAAKCRAFPDADKYERERNIVCTLQKKKTQKSKCTGEERKHTLFILIKTYFLFLAIYKF